MSEAISHYLFKKHNCLRCWALLWGSGALSRMTNSQCRGFLVPAWALDITVQHSTIHSKRLRFCLKSVLNSIVSFCIYLHIVCIFLHFKIVNTCIMIQKHISAYFFYCSFAYWSINSAYIYYIYDAYFCIHELQYAHLHISEYNMNISACIYLLIFCIQADMEDIFLSYKK